MSCHNIEFHHNSILRKHNGLLYSQKNCNDFQRNDTYLTASLANAQRETNFRVLCLCVAVKFFEVFLHSHALEKFPWNHKLDAIE